MPGYSSYGLQIPFSSMSYEVKSVIYLRGQLNKPIQILVTKEGVSKY